MKRGAIFLKCVVAMVLAIFFFAWITYLLWNWLVPVLFNGPIISYWQALGLLTLTKILFFFPFRISMKIVQFDLVDGSSI